MVSLDTFRNMEAILFPCGGGAEGEEMQGDPVCVRNLSMASKGCFQLVTRKCTPWGFLLVRLITHFELGSLDREERQTKGKEILPFLLLHDISTENLPFEIK